MHSILVHPFTEEIQNEIHFGLKQILLETKDATGGT